MNNPKKVLLCFTVLMLVMFGGMNIASAQTAEQIAEKALAATVYLEMKDRNGATLGFGSGFFVRENLIATNYHVIEGATSGTAKLVGKYTTYTIEGFTATDKINDLALLKVTAYSIKPLPLGMSSDVKIGETVYVAGNPKGLEGTFSDGIISSKRGGYSKERLQMTAPISPGSSGGPVLNRKGKVIGVSFMTLEGGQNLNFAIPSRALRVLLARSRTVKPLSQRSESISAQTYFKWGNTKYYSQDYNGAFEDYTKSIRLEPNSVVYFNRGLTSYRIRQYHAAISDYDVAIQIKSDFVQAYVNRGIVKRKLGQHFAAISDYDTAIRLKPDDFQAYYNRGLAKSALEQHFAAIDDYNTAIQIKPNLADAYVARGNSKSKLMQYLAAISDYNLAIQVKPNHTLAYLNRGLANGSTGRVWKAKQDFRRALKFAEEAGNAGLKAQIEKIIRSLE